MELFFEAGPQNGDTSRIAERGATMVGVLESTQQHSANAVRLSFCRMSRKQPVVKAARRFAAFGGQCWEIYHNEHHTHTLSEIGPARAAQSNKGRPGDIKHNKCNGTGAATVLSRFSFPAGTPRRAAQKQTNRLCWMPDGSGCRQSSFVTHRGSAASRSTQSAPFDDR